MNSPHYFTIVFLLLSVVLSSCEYDDRDLPSVDQLRRNEIVGGTEELGWEGVGALVEVFESSYRESYCTATLIHPSWLLTAAHCLIDRDETEVRFLVGTDARDSNNAPADGTMYPVEEFFVHQEFQEHNTWPVFSLNDIGLVRLSEPVVDVPTYPIQAEPLSEEHVLETVFYIGFGDTVGNSGEGGGVKRSVSIPITEIGIGNYSSKYDGTGVCFGDSGGPGFLNVGGQWTVIGVNANITPPEDLSESDVCHGHYNHTRVDVHAQWINDVMGAQWQRCDDQPASCMCDDACADDGWCENASCRVMDCASTYDCFSACETFGTACSDSCLTQASEEAVQRFEELEQCLLYECGDAVGHDAFQGCIELECAGLLSECQISAGELVGSECGSSDDCALPGAEPSLRVMNAMSPGSTCSFSPARLNANSVSFWKILLMVLLG